MVRRIEIDSVRGIACILLVLYHVIGEPDSGLLITSGPLRDVNDFLAYIRMPLFTFLSGYVYAWRPYESGAAAFVRGKARRLLLPMLTVGTVFAVLQALVPGTNDTVDSWYLLHVLPVAHFWFIESLFWLFLMIMVFEAVGLLRRPAGFAAVFAGATILYLLVHGTEYFSIAGTIYLLPYFLAGLGCSRFRWPTRQFLPMVSGVWVICLLTLLWFNSSAEVGRRSAAALAFGTSSCFLLVMARLQVRSLAYIGLYSYSIYLFHTFFTAATRTGLEQLGIASLGIHILVGCVFGIGFPILVDKIASQNRVLHTLALGKKWSPKLPWTFRAATITNRSP